MSLKLFSLTCVLLTIVATNAEHNSTGRIVGGDNAWNGQFPYQVSVRWWDSHHCGGAIITRNFVLTAAHCVGSWNNGWFYQNPADYHTVQAGSVDRYGGGVVVGVEYIKVHEQYDWNLSDLAVLKLWQPLDFWQNVQPISLAWQEPPPGSPVTISGWGYTEPDGYCPQNLKWNTLTALSRQECGEQVGVYSELMICLGHSMNNGVCQGDSGGPAVWNGQLVGIANFVYGYCGSWLPDGYANLYHHAEWVRWNTDV